MSDLQIGLVAVGAVVVAGILAYNALQERRARREAERAFGSAHADVLMDADGARREPRLDAPPRRAPAADDASLPDTRLDFVIELSLGDALPGPHIAARWAPHEHRFAGLARLAGSEDRAHWQALADCARCRALRVALQLANRAGPTSEATLIEFRAALDSLAAELGARVEAPEIRQAVEQGRELDALCAEADIQVVLHVMPPPGAEIGEPAPPPERTPFTVARGERGGIVLSLDVPRVPDVRRAYEAMVLHARELCTQHGGTLVDDNGRALDERALAAILAQLLLVCTELEARGIAPGSPAALRLFA